MYFSRFWQVSGRGFGAERRIYTASGFLLVETVTFFDVRSTLLVTFVPGYGLTNHSAALARLIQTGHGSVTDALDPVK